MDKNTKHKRVRSGNILLAEPFMLDSNFKRSAIFMCDHGEDGSVGFIMNKPLNMNVDSLIANFPEFEANVYFGGPVQTDTIHYIHRLGDILDDSLKVVDGIYWGGDFEKLKALIAAELVKPSDIRFFVGYAGWSTGQLHEELETGSWVVADMDANYIFKSEHEELWQQVMNHKGDVFSVIAQIPDHINWN